MNDSEQTTSEETLSPKEVFQWARQEIANSAKAFELRVKEATDLATRFAAGEISPQEAKQKLISFDRRWGEAMYGASVGENISDDQILAKIDEARRDARRPFSERGSSQNTPRSGR
jgi:hypothetical protein